MVEFMVIPSCTLGGGALESISGGVEWVSQSIGNPGFIATQSRIQNLLLYNIWFPQWSLAAVFFTLFTRYIS